MTYLGLSKTGTSCEVGYMTIIFEMRARRSHDTSVTLVPMNMGKGLASETLDLDLLEIGVTNQLTACTDKSLSVTVKPLIELLDGNRGL